jgi:hypothetical protein
VLHINVGVVKVSEDFICVSLVVTIFNILPVVSHMTNFA